MTASSRASLVRKEEGRWVPISRPSTRSPSRFRRQAVWDALTTPEVIERWFFGVDTVTDWSEGGPIVHTGTWQGKPYEDKGTVVRFDPPRLLVHAHWSPLSGLPDLP